MNMPTRMINGFNSVQVQIEAAREDVAVPDGIAISNGMYDKDLSYDLPPTAKTPMGMNKNGNQTLENKVWTDITNWTIRSGFPGTVITNNGLVVAEAQRANISVNLNYLFPSNSGNGMVGIHNAIRIVINGSVVKETTPERIISPKTGFTTDLNVGDVIKIQLWTNFWRFNSGFSTTYLSAILNASLSYVTFAPAKTGVVDFQNDLVFAEETKFIEKDNAIYVMPDGSKKTLPMTGATSNWTGSTSTNVQVTKPFGENYITAVSVSATPTGSSTISQTTSVNLGPVLAQSKIPYPVSEGMLVNMSGTLYVRRSGNQERTEDDGATGLMVRFALWGKGKESDEYGENDVDIELMWYQAELQNSNLNQSRTTMSYSLPEVEDVVIPPNIEKVYFTAALKQTVGDTYASASFENPVKLGSPSAYFGTPYSDPLVIKIQLPSLEQNTYKHPLSTTGVAFKNRKYFDHMQSPKSLTFFFYNSAVSLDIYRSSNMVRGALIGSYGASPGERKTVVVESDTGQIELVSSAPYWVESVKAIEYDTLNETQTTLERIEWTDVSEPLSNISATRSEYELSKMQLAFVSDDLANSDLLVPGKRVRLLINHYGNSTVPTSVYGDTYSPSYAEPSYNVAFTGMIRDYRVKYDYKNRPYIEVVVEDAHRTLTDSKGHYLYDLPMEYAPMLNGLGQSAVIDGVEVSGPWKAKTDSSKNQPSAFSDGLPVGRSLEAMRNTNKGFIFVDRMNKIQYTSSLNQDIKLVLSDSYSRSDISYSRLDKGTDTQSVINQVEPNEYKLDLDELDERTVSSEVPAKVESIQSMTQIAQWWYDQASIKAYGERKESFDVVRGTGNAEDIRVKQLGPGFHDWADEIMDDYVLAKNRVSRVMIIPDNFNDLKRLSELEIFDAIKILWKNEQHVCFIRKMEWTVVDNHVRLELYFARESSGVAWTPNVELAEGYTDLYFDIY